MQRAILRILVIAFITCALWIVVLASVGMSAEKFTRPFILTEYPPWRISSSYWSKRSYGYHKAVDYVVPSGTSIIAPGDGIISLAKWVRGYGNLIIIDHGDGIQTWIAHLSEFSKLKNNKVSKGDVIGFSGQSGNSLNSPHIHLEIRKNGRKRNPALFIEMN